MASVLSPSVRSLPFLFGLTVTADLLPHSSRNISLGHYCPARVQGNTEDKEKQLMTSIVNEDLTLSLWSSGPL